MKELLNFIKKKQYKIKKHITHEEYTEKAEPIMIPDDVYDEICDKIKQANITLFGVS